MNSYTEICNADHKGTIYQLSAAIEQEKLNKTWDTPRHENKLRA